LPVDSGSMREGRGQGGEGRRGNGYTRFLEASWIHACFRLCQGLPPPAAGNVCHVINPHDFAAEQARYYHANLFLRPRLSPELNIQGWLGRELQRDNCTNNDIRDAILHYSPMTDDPDSRFQLIMATWEMREAAWRTSSTNAASGYGHGNSILMDGTFGIPSKKILLFVIMVLDDICHLI
ncbi:hypothetical protein BDK51DRAFT_30296, partial [Blyttiomyces helicus]